MKRTVAWPLIGTTALVLGSIAPAAWAVPEPNPVPISWQLLLEPGVPMRIQVDAGSGLKTYWYMLYTATNKTGRDIDFHPEIVRVNEIDSEVPADQAAALPDRAASISIDPALVGVHPKVFAKIKERHAKTHPFLMTPIDAIARLKQGEDNAVTSVAVFPNLNPRVSRFTIYFGGLSGERIVRTNPSYDPRAGRDGEGDAGDGSNEKFFVLRKTLAIPYTLPGDVRTRAYATPKLGRMTWVMR